MLSETAAWKALETIPDPEIPVVSICDLGIVRDIQISDNAATVVITPTYSGCPATEMIEEAIRQTLLQKGASAVHIERRLAPAWTTDWIVPAAARRLREYGIAPPPAGSRQAQLIRFSRRAPPCPRCGSNDTERLSEFGSTACKALYRCLRCAEPFDYFKPI